MPSASTLDAETRDLLALHLLPGLGPRLTKALLDRFGSASRVLQANHHELLAIPHIGEQLATNLCTALRELSVDAELALIERHGVQLLRLGTDDYPARLATVFDPPQLLYARGDWLPEDGNAIAIVGSRHCTNYGKRVGERLSAGLARAGFTIVSGLARGIDRCAHVAALEAGGRTVAVLAGGLSQIYPPEHAELAEQIARFGALLSEAPMGLSPLAGMFPARNRLISGLSRGVVVVEAAEKSGALLTAKHALDQGREVFAVPGPVDSAASGGTNQLIRSGATLIRSVEDILEALGESTPPQRLAVSRPPASPLTETQQKVLDAMPTEPIHADELVSRAGLSVSELGTTLLLLEMQSLVRRLPGNRFEKRL